MIRKILLSLTLMSAGACIAAPLSPEEALSRLDRDLVPATRSAVSLKPVMMMGSALGEPTVYVFDTKDVNGFMVVSADDAVTPLLAYSDFSTFDPENISPALQNWLDQYSAQVEYVRANNLGSSEINTRVSLPAWQAIAPLVKTQWNQGAPYNNKCPLQNGRRTYTGCVATSMAQAMNYFKYPEKGQNSISYVSSTIGQNLSLDFSTLTFDWDNMLNSYNDGYNEAQANAVATLMMAAGYSVEMSYSTNQSGAISGYIPGALIKYFNYDKGAYYVSRSQKTYTEWATLIYNNLKNVGPVIYDGDTDFSGGHSFICDGYNGNGYFHFNWGWGGAGDGYFLLDALNPSAIGIGGALGGFNFRQDAVFNVKKPSGETPEEQDVVVLSGSAEGYTTGSYLYYKIYGNQFPGFRYYGATSMTFDVGISVVPANNTSATPNYLVCSNNSSYQNYSMPLDPGLILYCSGEYGYPYPMYPLSSLGLEDGVKYKVTAAYRPKGEDWLEATASVGCYNYFYVTKNGSNYEFENFPQMQFTCNNLSLLSHLYDGHAVEVNLTLSNPYDTELTRGATLVLLDEKDNTIFIGDSFVETLSPGQSITKDWTTDLSKQVNTPINKPTDFYLGLLDIDTQSLYYKSSTPVTMDPSPGVPEYECSIQIDNGKPDNDGIYVIDTSTDIEVTTDITVTKGYFSYPVTIHILAPLNSTQYSSVLSFPLDLTIIEEGETVPMQATLDFPEATVGTVYFLGPVVNNSGTLATQEVPFRVLSNEAGVEELPLGDQEILMYRDPLSGNVIVYGGKSGVAQVDVYSVNGMKLGGKVNYYGDKAELDLSSLGKGIVVVTATDASGNRKSVKLAL